MSRINLSLVLVLTLCLASVSLADDKQDQMKLQGKWKASEGRAKEMGMVMKLDGNKFNLSGDGQEFSGTFVIDSSKLPKTMDLTITGGKGDEVEKFKGKTSQAIYELDGDTFKWCAGEPGKDKRPTEFVDQGNLNIVFARDKE